MCKMHSVDYQCFMVDSCRPGNAGIWAKSLCVSVLGCRVLRCSGAQSGTTKAVPRLRGGFFSVKCILLIISVLYREPAALGMQAFGLSSCVLACWVVAFYRAQVFNLAQHKPSLSVVRDGFFHVKCILLIISVLW